MELNEYTIVGKTAEDMPDILDKCEEFFSEGRPEEEFNRMTWRQFWKQQLLDGRGLCLVARNEEEMVGIMVATLYVSPNTGKIHAQAMDWFVEEDHRGNGIGDKLFEGFERWAKSKEADFTEATIADHSSPIHEFYEDKGYEIKNVMYEKDVS